MKKITISILIPNFNHGHYLSLQLDSMINQNRKPDEIIIIDDASTDNSVRIIQEYAAKHKFIKLFQNKENKGVEYNINKLISHAKGDYIFLSAADDIILPEFLEEVEKAAFTYPDVGVISGIVRLIDEDGLDKGIRMMPLISTKKKFLNPSAVKKTLTRYGRWIQVSAMVLKREYVIMVGGQDVKIGSFADNFLANIIALKYGAYFIPKELGCWRKLDTGYGAASGRNVEQILRQGIIISKRMEIKYQDFFDKIFISRFFMHWTYRISQNLGYLDYNQRKKLILSNDFEHLCKLARFSSIKKKIVKLILLNIDNSFINIFLFFPKMWGIRSRISVMVYLWAWKVKEF